MALANVLNQGCLSIRLWQEEGMFIAKCPGIPGCVSEAPSHDQVLANIREAISLCLEVIQEDVNRARYLSICNGLSICRVVRTWFLPNPSFYFSPF
jgi:predicted RNase H-like HicB family nuclease